MDKESKILELNLKILALNLEKEKELHKTAISFIPVIIAGITSIYTSGYVNFGKKFADFVAWTLSGPSTFYNVIIIFIWVVIIPILVGIIVRMLFEGIYIKSKEEIYNNAIKNINKLIDDVEKSDDRASKK